MLPNSLKSLFKQAGGRWFLDTKLLLIISPMVITTSVLTTPAIPIDHTFAAYELTEIYIKLLVANIFALGFCALLIVGAAKTIFRNRNLRPVSFAIVLFFSAGIGAIKGVVTAALSWQFAVEADLATAISSRIVQTTLLGLWLIPAVALVGYRLEMLRNQREALVAERVQLALKKPEVSEVQQNVAALGALNEQFRTELQNLARSNDAVPSAKYADIIRKLVTDEVRPLSHRLWELENSNLPGFSIRETLKTAIFRFADARLIVAIVYFITYVVSITRAVAFDEAVFRGLVASLLIYAAYWLARLIKSNSYALRLSWLIAITLAVSVIGFYSGEAIFGQLAAFRPIETIIGIWIWLFQLTFMSSFLLGIRKSEESLAAELAELLGDATLDKAARISQARMVNRDFANYLHGQVQNKLLSVALNLEQNDPNEAQLNSALASIESILLSANSSFQHRVSGSLSDAIVSSIKQWAGFVDVAVAVDDKCETVAETSKLLIIQLVEEGVANAVRHGLAKNIAVRVSQVTNGTEIEVLDDGLGPRNGKPGMGVSLFRNSANGNWFLEPQESGGSRLSILLPN